MTRNDSRNNRNVSIQSSSHGIRIRTLSLALAVILCLVSLGGSAQAGSFWDAAQNLRNKARRAFQETVAEGVALIPDGALVESFDGLRPRMVTDLLEVAGNAQDIIQFLRTQQKDFAHFKSSGGAEAVRSDVRALIVDVETIADRARQIRCFADPDAELNTDHRLDGIAGLFDRLPPIALYTARNVLDRIAPEWRTQLGDVSDMIPEDFGSEVCDAAGDGIAQLEMLRCDALRRVARPVPMKALKLAVVTYSEIYKVAMKFMPEDLQLTIAVVAVGGGGVGTDIELPLKGIFKAITVVLDQLAKGIDLALKDRGTCEAADDRMERDLISCTALASYDANFEVIQDLAARRVTTLDVTNEQFNAISFARDFNELCESYQDIRYEE